MAWNTLATGDVTGEILPDEVSALNSIQGSNTVLAGILANVIAETQGSILAGGNQIGQPGTVPDQIRGDVIAIARWRWFTALPKTDLQSDARRAHYEEAVKRIGAIRSGQEKVEIPTNPQNSAGPSYRMETIRRGHKLDTHSFDTLGET